MKVRIGTVQQDGDISEGVRVLAIFAESRPEEGMLRHVLSEFQKGGKLRLSCNRITVEMRADTSLIDYPDRPSEN